MFRLILGLVISAVITNWAYSELVLIDPKISYVLDDAIQALSLPTHDNWGLPDTNVYIEIIDNKFSSLKENTIAPIFSVTDRLTNIKRLVFQKRRGDKTLASPQRSFELLSGDAIFISHSRSAINNSSRF